MSLQRAQVRDQVIAYRREGTGPTLVLLHGFLCDSRCWRTQLDVLSDSFTVIAWDAPGAGSSTDPPEIFTTADWTATLADFLDGLGVGRAIFGGLSWGGILAQDFYRRFPDRVLGLILADTYVGWSAHFPPDVVAKRLERCNQDSFLPADEFVPRWVPEMFSSSATNDVKDDLARVFREFHPHGFRLMAISTAETSSTDLLPQIEVPTLLIWGDEDQRSPLFVAELFHSAIPGSELVVIKGAGHVSNMERPDEFNSAVRRFAMKVSAPR